MIPSGARAHLAPGGTLRAGINYANSVIATKDFRTGALRGVSVDLVRELRGAWMCRWSSSASQWRRAGRAT